MKNPDFAIAFVYDVGTEKALDEPDQLQTAWMAVSFVQAGGARAVKPHLRPECFWDRTPAEAFQQLLGDDHIICRPQDVPLNRLKPANVTTPAGPPLSCRD